LINYFKSYSSLGDDRFFVSLCNLEKRFASAVAVVYTLSFVAWIVLNNLKTTT